MAKITRRDFLKLSALLATTFGASKTASSQSLKRPPTWWGNKRAVSIPSVCEMCFWKCGIRGKVVNGRLVRIEGNPEHPLSEGKICARGNAGLGLLYDPDRLKFPLKRIGARGEGHFKRISWDEAMDIIARKFKDLKEKYGARSVALFPHGSSSYYFTSAMFHFGSDQYSMGSFFQCRGPMVTAYKLTFGKPIGSPDQIDLENAKLIMLFGAHLGENAHVSQVKELIRGISNGAKLVVVDPRYSTAASKADYWIAIKPGTDLYFLLTLINTVIQKGLYDKEYVEKYTYGFEELKEAVSEYSPEKAEKITQISRKTIEEIAELLGKSKPSVVIHPGRHTTWHGNDTQRERAMAILTAILGAYGREGGIFIPTSFKTGKCPCTKNIGEKIPCPENQYPLREEGMPVECLIKKSIGDNPEIRAWVIYGQNILHSAPNPYRTMEALKKLEFVVAVDVLPSDTVLWADIVLPESTYLERYEKPFKIRTAKTPFLALRQPIVEPMYDTKDGFTISKLFLNKLGLKECFPCNSIEEVIESIIKPSGVSFTQLKAKGIAVFGGNPFPSKLKFKTPTGKIELYSTVLEKHGFDPIPKWEPVEEPPKGYFRLIYGRSPVHSFSRTINNPLLSELMPENFIWINDEIGKKMGLSDFDRVRLKNQDGYLSNEGYVRLTPGIRGDVVYVVHGFGIRSKLLKRAFNKGISDNYLITKVKYDPITGGAGLRLNFVKIVKNESEIDAPLFAPATVVLKRAQKRGMIKIKKHEGNKSIKPKKQAPPPSPGGGGDEDEGGC